ncbi:TPR end-of-group domain-containing protein [Stieleria varia]|nr:hypothetical protein [Stieleria varia]
MAYINPSSSQRTEQRSDEAVERGQAILQKLEGQGREQAAVIIEKAIPCFEKALAIWPGNLEARFQLANAKYFLVDCLDDPERQCQLSREAIELLRAILRQEPGHEATEDCLAKCLFRLGEHTTAQEAKIACFDEAIEITQRLIDRVRNQPDDDADPQERIDCLVDLTHFIGTVFEFRAECESDNRMVWFEQAIKYSSQSIELDPMNVGARYGFARSLMEMSRSVSEPTEKTRLLQESLAANERLIRDLPSFDSQDPFFEVRQDWTPRFIEYNYACALAMLGQTERAIDALWELADDDSILFSKYETDEDLDSLRDHPRFKQLMADKASR